MVMDDVLGVVTPRGATPRVLTPSILTPRGATPGVLTPWAALTPSILTPRGATPGVLTPWAATPGVLTPGVATPRLGTPEHNVEQKLDEISTKKLFVEETKKLCYIATVMVLVTTSQYLLRFVSMLMIGRLGKLELSGAVVAMSLTNVTGFSLLFGMASALETLCGQAFGAGQLKKLSSYTYGAIISLLLVCIPLSVLWIFVDKILILLHQDHQVSHEAGKYSILLIPALFPYAILQPLTRFLQSQSLILPLLLSSIGTLLFHVLICWIFVFKLDFGAGGAALAIGVSYWVNVALLVLYIVFSPECAETRGSWSLEAVRSIKEFFPLAVPSALMVCLEWWAYEVIILLSGIMSNPEVETSVLSVCLTIATLHYFIPFSFGAAVSIRVSNELGAGNHRTVRVAVWSVMILGVSEVIIAAIVLFFCRNFLGRAFVDDKEVVDYVKRMTPFLCLTVILDGFQGILSGVARGTGWQKLGAYINLGSYYLIGIPAAILLGFLAHLKAKGLWIGLVAGSLVQSVLLVLITSFINWKKEATETREKLVEMKSPPKSTEDAEK